MSKLFPLACAVCVTLAALAQLALISSGAAGEDLRGLPLLPLAALAGWAAVRGPAEAWGGLLPAPLLLGLASDERAGWFVLALLPTPLLAVALRGRHGALRVLVAAGAAAAGGFVLYSVLLAGVVGDGGALIEARGALGAGAVRTSLLAALLATALLPLRPRRRGLFD